MSEKESEEGEKESEKKLRWKRENYFLNSRLTGCQDATEKRDTQDQRPRPDPCPIHVARSIKATHTHNGRGSGKGARTNTLRTHSKGTCRKSGGGQGAGGDGYRVTVEFKLQIRRRFFMHFSLAEIKPSERCAGTNLQTSRVESRQPEQSTRTARTARDNWSRQAGSKESDAALTFWRQNKKATATRMKAQLNANIIVSVFGATGRQGRSWSSSRSRSRSRSRRWSSRRSRRRQRCRQRPYSETFSKREKVTNWPSCLVPLYSRSASLLCPLPTPSFPCFPARLNAFRFLFIFYSNVATKMAQTLRSYLCFFLLSIAKQKNGKVCYQTLLLYIYMYIYIV